MEAYYLHSLKESVVIRYLSNLKILLTEQVSVFNQITESIFLNSHQKIQVARIGENLDKWIREVVENELLNNNTFLALKHTNVVYGNTLKKIVTKLGKGEKVDRNEYKVLMTAHELMIKDLLAMIGSLTETKFQADPLTGAINRAAFEGILETEVTKIQRTGSKSFLVFADIDFFKKINDEFGHSDGDEVLIEVVSIFKEVVRNSDTVSRWGGEEFLILLADTNISNANKVIERIRIAIESSSIKTSKGVEINLTCSFGFSELTIDYEETIKRSDGALYEAKDSGRNRIVYRAP